MLSPIFDCQRMFTSILPHQQLLLSLLRPLPTKVPTRPHNMQYRVALPSTNNFHFKGTVHQPNKFRLYAHFVLFHTFFLTMTPFTSKKSSKILLESSRSIPCNAINERHIEDTLDTPDMCICNCDYCWSIKASQLPATPTHPIEI